MTRVTVLGLAGLMILMLAPPLRAGERGGDAAAQRMLDDMTRHDLCARDDAGLRRLNRSLSKHPLPPHTRSN